MSGGGGGGGEEGKNWERGGDNSTLFPGFSLPNFQGKSPRNEVGFQLVEKRVDTEREGARNRERRGWEQRERKVGTGKQEGGNWESGLGNRRKDMGIEREEKELRGRRMGTWRKEKERCQDEVGLPRG